MRKQRILFILPKFEFGGTVFSTFNMIRMLEQHKVYDIFVFPMISDGPVRQIYNGINVLDSDFLIESSFANRNEYHGLKKVKILTGKVIKKLSNQSSDEYNRKLYKSVAAKLQHKYHFDYVASCQEGDSTEFVSYFEDCKKIAWFRSEMSVYRKKHITWSKADRLPSIYSRMDNIVCVSKTTRDDFAQYFPEIDNRIQAIHNIQDVEEIENKANVPVPDPFDTKFFTIVSVGRISTQKRFSEIPRIASELVNAGITGFRWYIIGDGNKDGEYDRLLNALVRYGMGEYVKLIGSRTNPYPYIKSADILAIPSSYEACPRVVAEAHILKTPVVSADYSSASEFVKNGVDGFVGTIYEQSTLIKEMFDKSDRAKRVYDNCRNFKLDTRIILRQLYDVFS